MILDYELEFLDLSFSSKSNQKTQFFLDSNICLISHLLFNNDFYDSYVDDNEDELFLSSANLDELFRWFNKADLPQELYEPF